MLVLRIVVAAAYRLPAGADAELIELAIQVQAHGAPGTTRQCAAGIAVARVYRCQPEATLPAEQLLLERGFNAIDACRTDVLRAATGEHNRILDIRAV